MQDTADSHLSVEKIASEELENVATWLFSPSNTKMVFISVTIFAQTASPRSLVERSKSTAVHIHCELKLIWITYCVQIRTMWRARDTIHILPLVNGFGQVPHPQDKV